VKLDALYTYTTEGDIAATAPGAVAGRDFYVPAAIPTTSTGPNAGQEHQGLDFHAKETRLFLKVDTTVDGNKLGGYVEFDFITSATSGGNERVSNGYTPALRRAYVTYNNWLLGQDWSTFQPLVALPETLDFVAWPSDGTVFSRQGLIRYTSGGWDLALENPQTTVTCGAGLCGGATSIVADDNRVPDVVIRYRATGSAGGLSIAAIGRELRVDNATALGLNTEAYGGGLSIAGKLNLGTDDVRFAVTAGEGLGRYLALNLNNDVEATTIGGSLDPQQAANGFIAYRRAWTPKWRTNLVASAYSADSESSAFGSVTRQVESGSINLLYSPTPKYTVGLELRYAHRELESEAEGELYRSQFSAKYLF
jgi:hypothetical protein